MILQLTHASKVFIRIVIFFSRLPSFPDRISHGNVVEHFEVKILIRGQC